MKTKLIKTTETRKKVYRWVAETLEKLEVDYPSNMFIKFSNRMTRAVGKCRAEHRFDSAYSTYYTLTFSNKLFARATEKEKKSTVIHEVCHMVEHMQRNVLSHSKYWKNLMRKCGEEPSRESNIEASDLTRRNKRYTVYCACDTHQISGIRYSRLKKGLAKYRCGCCNQHVTLEKQ